jgi:hypothetical protein
VQLHNSITIEKCLYYRIDIFDVYITVIIELGNGFVTMTKILKDRILKQLNDRFPQIKRISKGHSTRQLEILVSECTEKKFKFLVWIESANLSDKSEPYTQETLKKTIIEFPEQYQKRRKEYLMSL